jgi:glucokinase
MKDLTVGIDIGGTNTKYGIVDRKGNVLHQGNIPTTEYNEFQAYFDGMADALRGGIQELPSDSRIVGIGIGAANGNYYTGNIERATNLKWKGVLLWQCQEHERLCGDNTGHRIGKWICVWWCFIKWSSWYCR